MKQSRNWAPLVLVLMTTACAELTFTALAVPFTFLLLPLLMVMYGAGVLLIREAVVRVGGGWPSLALLGVAYQLAEDGLGLQALTSEKMYGAADWGVRALGLNLSYWEGQIGVHVVLSVLVPIAIVDLLFPQRRSEPYLRTGGLVTTGVLAVVGVLGLRFLISADQHPGYQTPVGWTLFFLAGIAVLAYVALLVVPRRRTPERRIEGRRVPPVGVVGFVSMYLTMAFLTTVLPLGLDGDTMLMGDMMTPVMRLFIGLMTGVPFAIVVARWRRSAAWGDRHRIWLIGGILVSHSVFMMPATVTAMVLGAVATVLQVVLLIMLAKHVSRRETAINGSRRGAVMLLSARHGIGTIEEET